MKPPSFTRLFQGALLLALGVSLLVVANTMRVCFLTQGSFAETRARRIVELAAQRNQLDQDLAKIRARIAGFPAQIVAEEEKIRQADKIIAQLRELESTWDRLVGNPAQQKANAEQIARMQQLRTESTNKITELRDETKRSKWEQDGLDIEQARVNSQLEATSRHSWALTYYLGLGWEGVRRWVLGALGLYAAGCLFVVWLNRWKIMDS